jgi:hypothetical protein
MSSKKTFVLRLDEAMYKALEKWASDEFRSVNGQIEWLLQTQLKENGRVKGTAPVADKKKTEK